MAGKSFDISMESAAWHKGQQLGTYIGLAGGVALFLFWFYAEWPHGFLIRQMMTGDVITRTAGLAAFLSAPIILVSIVVMTVVYGGPGPVRLEVSDSGVALFYANGRVDQLAWNGTKWKFIMKDRREDAAVPGLQALTLELPWRPVASLSEPAFLATLDVCRHHELVGSEKRTKPMAGTLGAMVVYNVSNSNRSTVH